jgi:hypothetical protein
VIVCTATVERHLGTRHDLHLAPLENCLMKVLIFKVKPCRARLVVGWATFLTYLIVQTTEVRNNFSFVWNQVFYDEAIPFL